MVAAVLLLLAVAIFLRSKAPPEAARLLPESDGILYINFKPIRAFFHKDLTPPAREPEYQRFVDATGIDWERDLDEAAVALHRMPDPNGPNGPVAYSMVLEGKLTGPRLRTWLESHAASREVYAGKTIYNIPSEGRTVRVCQIGYDMVATSNYPTPEMIHSMIDRHRTAALPFAGNTLLSQHYHEIPLLSIAWGMGQIGLPFNESGAIKILGLELPLESDSTIIASVTPELSLAGSLGVRVEEIAPTDEAAASQAAALNMLVTLARGVAAPLSDRPANQALKDLLKTAEITQKHDRVLINATFPTALFSEMARDEKNSSQGATTPGGPASH